MTTTFRHDQPENVLSPRQLELLKLLGAGLSLADAAGRMGISRKTATAHKNRLMWLLDLRTRRELVAYAHERGLNSASDSSDQ